MRFMLDTNIYDALDGDPATLEEMKRLTTEGKIVVLTTHIQHDELGRIPDLAKRARLLAIPAQRVVTAGAIWGKSRWGLARWGRGNYDGINIDAIRKRNLKHNEDALIAVTAAREADVLVTEEKRELRKRVEAQAQTLKVWDYQEFKAFIASQL